MKYYTYTRHRYLSDTPLGLHTSSATLSALPRVEALLLGSHMSFENTKTANSRLEVTPHLETLAFQMDEVLVEGFSTLR